VCPLSANTTLLPRGLTDVYVRCALSPPQDRWEYEHRTVEELKQRYFTVAKALMEARAARPEEVRP
jgi:hypothetical protein